MGTVLPPFGWTQFVLAHSEELRSNEPAPSVMRWTPSIARQIGKINSDINAAIKFDPATTDREWMLSPKTGCCHDYVVSKRHALLKIGWPVSCLLIAEVHDESDDEDVDHLVLICRTDKANFVLDSKTDAMLSELPGNYTLKRIQTSDPAVWTDKC